MNLDLRLIRQVHAVRLALGLVILCGLAAAAMIVLQARLVSLIVARVFLDGWDLAQASGMLLALLAVIFTRSAAALAGDLAAASAAAKIKNSLRQALLEKLEQLGPIYPPGLQKERRQSGELASVALQNIDALDAYFSQYLPQLLLAALIPLGILAVVFYLDLLSTIILLVTAPLIPLFMILIGSTAEQLTRRQWQTLGRMSAVFLETLQGLPALKALNRSAEQKEKIAAASEHYRQTTMSVLRVTFLSSLALEILSTLSTAIIAVQIGLRLLYGSIAFQDAFFILIIAPDYYFPLRQLGLRFHAAASAAAAAQKIFAVIDLPPEPAQPRRSPPAAPAPPGFNLTFDGVSYRYPGRQKPALHNVSFTIPEHQLTALAGPSGSGKSTLFNLLLRFIEPQSGVIWVSGAALNTIPPDVWRAFVAWVPQQPYLFNDTIQANIRLGKPAAASEQVQHAARQAHLHEFITALPQDYDTVVGEAATRLSGGQRQRLALARAWLRNAPFILLDEPTAYLDPELEAQFLQSLDHLRRGRTVLMIAHTRAALDRADRIIHLDRGRIR